MSISPYLESITSIKKLIDKLKKLNINLSHIDVGGGIGISYENEENINKTDYVNTITEAFANLDVTSFLNQEDLLLVIVEHS